MYYKELGCFYLLLTVTTKILFVESTPPLPRSVGYTDVTFSYVLRMELSGNDDEKLNQTRATTMRIFYPTTQEEGTEPDDAKDRYFDICSGGGSFGDKYDLAIRMICIGDVERVTATPDAPLSRESDLYNVLLFSSGKGNIPLQYTSLIQDVVRRGFIVVALSHPLVDLVARVNGEDVEENEELTTYQRLLLDSADARAAIDSLDALNTDTKGKFFDRLDFESGIGYMGHSLGGASAMLTAIDDNRVTAVIDMDGLFFFFSEGHNLADELSVPWMLMASPFNWHTQFYWAGLNAWQNTVPEGSVAFFLKKSGHLAFTDICHSQDLPWSWLDRLVLQLNCGSINPDEMDEVVLEYTVAFFRFHLQNDESSRQVLEEKNDLFGEHYYK